MLRFPKAVLVVTLSALVPLAAHAQKAVRLGSEFRVNSFTYGTQRAYSNPVASDGAGNYIVVWHDEGVSTTEAQRLDSIFQRTDRFGLPANNIDKMTRLRQEKLVPLKALGGRK